MHRLLLTLSNSCAVPQQFVYFKEKEGLLLTVQRGRIFHNLVFVSLMATDKPSAHGDPHATEMSNWGCSLADSSMAQCFVPSPKVGNSIF